MPLRLFHALPYFFVAAALASCADAPPRRDAFVGPPSADRATGDRDDIEVSVDAALARVAVAPVAVALESDGALVYELRTAADEPGWLRVRLDEPAQPGGPVQLRMDCRIGRFGHPDLERRLMDSIAHRLSQLQGRAVAPIRW